MEVPRAAVGCTAAARLTLGLMAPSALRPSPTCPPCRLICRLGGDRGTDDFPSTVLLTVPTVPLRSCTEAGIHVHKPSRFEAIRFAVEYDLQMDVLPGDDPAMPNGCMANYYTGPEYDPGHKARGKPKKWNPHPKPAATKCNWPHFVPMGCHKCWRWNWRTWKHMSRYCPEAVEMRKRRAEYKVGIEFTGWPSRPKVTPVRGPTLADPRYLPIDMKKGTCKGRCATSTPRSFERTQLGVYHK